MAQPAGTFSTYDAVGIREDLSDVIYNVDPTETPNLTAWSKVRATNTKHEWQTDSLAAASDANAVIEGDDATTDASTATVRLDNQCQISDKVARVTGTQEAVNKAGRDDEMAYQLIKRGKELKRDMESSLTANNAKVVGDDSTARELAGLGSWIGTNDDFGATGASPATLDGAAARTDGTQRAFDETQLNNVFDLVWNAGGNPNRISLGSFNKRVFSGFTGVATKEQQASTMTIIAGADVYVSDFGTCVAVPNRFQRGRDAFVLDDDYWAVAFLRNMQQHDLAKTGDTERKQLIVEYTLESRNEKASGGVFDLTTS